VRVEAEVFVVVVVATLLLLTVVGCDRDVDSSCTSWLVGR